MKTEQMALFRRECAAFFKPLWPGEDKPLVFGEGALRAPVMLVGEAPGEQEVLQGRPFVGRAGKNLDGFLAALSLSREDIYITNVVKIRPTRAGKKGMVNRPPTREEIALFLPWLEREIALVAPRALVTLGNVPLRTLTHRGAVIGDMHGKWHQSAQGLPLFALYHPAAVLYHRALLDTYRQDLLTLAATLDARAPV